MDNQKHLIQLKKFKTDLSKKITIDRMILFGSRAYGKPHRWSDFDIVIVSKNFKAIDSLKRSIGIHSIWNLDYPVDFLCYSPDEFNRLKRQISVVREAVKKGIEI